MDHLNTSPYVGPRKFREDEHEKFFGRNQEARDLISLVRSERLVLFYAQSGAGKSSLINARLRPGLRRRNFKLLPVGRVSGALPEDIEMVDNIFVFNLVLSLDQNQHDAAAFSQTTLWEYLQNHHTITPTDKETGRVLIIDQFEEIQTTNTEHWAKRKGFFEQLAQALDEDPLLWVVLALREDYVAGLDPYAHLLPGKLGTRFYMQRLGHQAALEAVKRPAEKAGRPFEEGVAETLVDNLRQIQLPAQEAEAHYGQFVEPVQLQVVCYQLWENLAKDDTRKEITSGDLRRLAGGTELGKFVDKALAQFYNQAVQDVVQKHPHLTEFEVRDWFEDKLITKAQTRALVFENPKTQITEGLDQDVVTDFQARFLLRGERRGGGQWYELVHDRFVDPILQANAEWRRDHPVLRDAREWKITGNPERKLYQGERLVEAFDHPDATMALVQEFLAASQKVEADQRQALLADEQAKRTRNLKWGITIISIITLIGIGLAIVALMEQGKAKDAQAAAETAATAEARARQEAEGAQATAEARRVEAEDAKATAELAATAEAGARQEAEDALAEVKKQEKIGNSRRLAIAAVENLDRYPKLSLLLAIEAAKESTTSEAENALRQAVDTSQVQAVLNNHTDNVNALAFSPDGRFVVTASDDNTARVWEVESGNQIHAVKKDSETPSGDQGSALELEQIRAIEHDYEVLVVTYSHGRDGDSLATGSRDGEVRVLNVVPLEENFKYEDKTSIDHRAEVSAIAFNPEGTLLVTAGVDGKARVWKIPSGEERELLEGHTNQINAVAWSPDGRRIATASEDGTARLWDIETGEQLTVLSHEPSVNALAFSKDGVLATAGVDGIVRLWNAESGELLLHVLTGHRDRITAVDFSPDGQWLVTASADSTARLWDVSSGRLYGVFEGHTSSINAVAFSPGEGPALFATASSDNTARLWTLDDPGVQTVLRGHEGIVLGLALHPTVDLLASSGEDGTLRLWDVPTAIQTAGAEGEERVISLENEAEDFFLGLDFSLPDGSLLAATILGGTDVDFFSGGVVRLWDVSQILAEGDVIDRPVTSIPTGPFAFIFNLAFHPSDSLLAVGGARTSEDFSSEELMGFVSLMDVSVSPIEGIPIFPDIAREMVFGLAFDPNGEILATASSGEDPEVGIGAVRLWDISGSIAGDELGEELAVLRGQAGFFGVAFSPNGQLLAAGAGDGTVSVWDAAAARNKGIRDSEIAVLGGRDPGPVFGVAFSPDGGILATGSIEGDIRLWDVSTALEPDGTITEIAVLQGHEGDIPNLIFNPNGGFLASSGEDGTIRLWVIGIDSLLDLACRNATRNMTQNEWDAYFGDETYRRTCDNLPVHLTAAQEYVRQGNVFAALAALREALELDPTLDLDPEAEVAAVLVEQGRAFLDHGDYDEALATLREAADLDPKLELEPEIEVAAILLSRGQTHLDNREYDEALAAFKRAAELDPNLDIAPETTVAEALVRHAETSISRDDFEGALAAYQRATQLDPTLDIVPEAEVALARGRSLARQGEVDEALTALREATDLDPDLELKPEVEVAAIFLSQGQTHLDDSEYDEALAAFERAAELDPNLDIAPETTVAEALVRHAETSISQDDFEGALAAYQRATQLDPTLEIVPEAEVALARGRDLADQGEVDEALATLRRALELDPDLALEPEVEVAAFLTRQGQTHLDNREYDEALAAFERAVELDPTLEIVPEAEVALARGRDLADQGEVDEALAALSQALEIEELRASDFADVYAQVCGKSRVYGFSSAILTACERAVELAIGMEDAYLNRGICENGSLDELAEVVSPACERAVELAVEAEDATLNRDLCQMGSVEQLTEVVLPACTRAVELAVQTERATLNRDLCQIGSVEGLRDVVLPACTRAVELAIETEDVTLSRELCQIEAVEGLADAVQPACERAAELTKTISSGETASGRVSPGGSYAWTFQGKKGQIVTVTMKAVNNGFDTYLSLLGPEGPPPLITNDDDPALGLNSRIAGFELPQDGPYVIIATGLSKDDFGTYTLSLVVENGE